MMQSQELLLCRFLGELTVFSKRLHLYHCSWLIIISWLLLAGACAPPMEVVTGSEGLVAAEIQSAGPRESPNAAVPKAASSDNSRSEAGRPQASGLDAEPRDSISASKMLELMEESNREATRAMATQPSVSSPHTLPEVSIIEESSTGGSRGSVVVPSDKLVAILVPLTGRAASLGDAMLNAAQMAVFDTFDDTSRLIIQDTKGTPAGAEDAVRLVLAEGARVIIGPLFNTSVRAVAPLVRSAGVPMIVFSNDRSVAGDGIYVFGFTPEQEVRRILTFASSKGRVCRVALVPANAYGQAISTAFTSNRKELGSTQVIETFSPDGSNITEVVKELAARNVPDGLSSAFDCLLIASGGDQLRAIATRLPYYDVNMASLQLLGTALWQSDRIGKEPALRGGWFAGPATGTFDKFSLNYNVAFNSRPPFRTALAYDAVSLVGQLISEPSISDGADQFREVLLREAGFEGVQGIFRFRQDGMVERPLAVYEVTRRGFKLLDPATGRFSD